MGAAITIRGLDFAYADRAVLKDLNLEIEANRLFALLGPNGSGKTTLFKILATLLPTSAGVVTVLENDVAARPNLVRKRIGVVFQNGALDKNLTVEENLSYQGYFHSLHGQVLRQRVEQLLKLVNLWERRKEKIAKLSGGLKRRVEIVRALVHSPKLLLLDEPTVGLDPVSRREIWDYLTTLQKEQGLTVVATTHYLFEAEACHRVGILSEGRLIALDEPAKLISTLGGDIVEVRAADPESLKQKIQNYFQIAPTVLEGKLRIEIPSGHEFIPKLILKFPQDVQSVTFGRPNLEDYFIHMTGRRLPLSAEVGVA